MRRAENDWHRRGVSVWNAPLPYGVLGGYRFRSLERSYALRLSEDAVCRMARIPCCRRGLSVHLQVLCEFLLFR